MLVLIDGSAVDDIGRDRALALKSVAVVAAEQLDLMVKRLLADIKLCTPLGPTTEHSRVSVHHLVY